MSWGLEGAIRYWNREGESIPGGDPGAHRCGAKGVLGLKDGRLVSWGFDGGIRFWSQEGLRFNSIKYGS